MSARISSATERALARVAKGESAYSAARKEGIARSTIYRALKRIRLEDERNYANDPRSHGPDWEE